MTYPIDIPLEQIAEISDKWSITKLALFGSVLREDFNASSDIDILVYFDEPVILSFKDWDDIESALSDAFGRDVDLVDWKAIEHSPNYIRRKEILSDAQVIELLSEITPSEDDSTTE